jgi:hypothetical protein
MNISLELRREGVHDQRARAQGGDQPVGAHVNVVGPEQLGQFDRGRWEDDQQQHEQADPRDAAAAVFVDVQRARLDPVVEPQQQEQAGQHDGAERQAVAKRAFHRHVRGG